MKHIVNSEWKGNLTFKHDLNGHKITTDATAESGGNDLGASPKMLLLAGLAGCTGMDVVSILKKMRVDINSCLVRVEGIVRDEHPKYYEDVRVIYTFKGKDLPMDKLTKAVNMSQETYCGVAATLKEVAKISTEIIIED